MTTQAAKTDRRHVAYHEAGHAVVCILLGYELKNVTIKASKRAQGRANIILTGSREFMTIPMIMDNIKIDLAGALADGLVDPTTPFSDKIKSHAYRDWQSVRRFARQLGMDPSELNWTIEELKAETAALVEQNAEAIVRVAEALLEHATLTGEEAAKIMRAEMGLAEPPTIFDGFCFEPRVERQAAGFRRRM